MSNNDKKQLWFEYIETPPRSSIKPVKIDRILAERMKAFLKARETKAKSI